MVCKRTWKKNKNTLLVVVAVQQLWKEVLHFSFVHLYNHKSLPACTVWQDHLIWLKPRNMQTVMIYMKTSLISSVSRQTTHSDKLRDQTWGWQNPTLRSVPSFMFMHTRDMRNSHSVPWTQSGPVSLLPFSCSYIFTNVILSYSSQTSWILFLVFISICIILHSRGTPSPLTHQELWPSD